MKAGEAKHRVRQWIELHQSEWVGIRAAHFVGGITALADEAEFPAYKDVDLHLVFDDEIPPLPSASPFMSILEEEFEGVLIEAGVKSVAEYRSPEAVLANPEIAHHLTLDSVLYDPDGVLSGLQAQVRRRYAERQWVQARIAYERAGVRWVYDRRAGVPPSVEANLIGYSFTFITAALAVAALKPPAVGGRMAAHLHEHLAASGRPDLYEDVLAVLGVQDASPRQVEALLREAAALFDRAVLIQRSPFYFAHKMQPHLRPYFVDTCHAMLAQGLHREALVWTVPFHLAATDIILVDGEEPERPGAVECQHTLLHLLGMDTPEGRADRWEQAERLHEACFAIADQVALRHPAHAA